MRKSIPRIARVMAAVAVLVGAATLAPPSGAASRPDRVAPAASVTVATAGDIAKANSPGSHQRQTADLIRSMHPDAVFMLGDGQYERGEYAQYLRSYDPTWGAFKNITDPVPGNHEYETANADGYFRYFADQLSGRGASASDPHKGYYSFNIGDWHIVALNSNCHFSNCGAQASWLRSDVASDDHLCELVMFHDPGRRDFESAAAAAHVDLALAGHQHRYERWDRVHGLNLRLMIVGTGGKSSGTPNQRADAKFKGYGVVRLDLDAIGYSWQFIEVGGHVRDSGSGTCHD